MSPTAISNAAKLLEAQGLVVDGRPSLPDLFWALADVWRPAKVAFVKEASRPDEPAAHLRARPARPRRLGRRRRPRRARARRSPLRHRRPSVLLGARPRPRCAARNASLGNTDRESCKAIVAAAPTSLVCTRRLPTTKGDEALAARAPALPRARPRPRPGPWPRDPRQVEARRHRTCLGLATVPFVAVPDALAPMLDALHELTATNVPPLALVGGLAVNLRLAVGDEAHRTTRDIDVVAGDDIPGVIDVLGEPARPDPHADRHGRRLRGRRHLHPPPHARLPRRARRRHPPLRRRPPLRVRHRDHHAHRDPRRGSRRRRAPRRHSRRTHRGEEPRGRPPRSEEARDEARRRSLRRLPPHRGVRHRRLARPRRRPARPTTSGR